MTFGRKTWNTITLITLLVMWFGINLLLFFPDGEIDDEFFSLLFVLIGNMILAAGVGIGLLLMRMFRVSKAQLGAPYIVLGVLNPILGIAGIVALSVTEFGQAAIMCAANIVIGLTICVDSCIKWKRVLRQ